MNCPHCGRVLGQDGISDRLTYHLMLFVLVAFLVILTVVTLLARPLFGF